MSNPNRRNTGNSRVKASSAQEPKEFTTQQHLERKPAYDIRHPVDSPRPPSRHPPTSQSSNAFCPVNVPLRPIVPTSQSPEKIEGLRWRSFKTWKENRSFQINLLHKPPHPPSHEGPPSDSNEDYSHVFRSKTRAELVRLSATVMGIEFSYAAETAFVSPALLQIGVNHAQMTMAWALSPIVGFVLTPILGSLSDKCTLPYGRRRPFILLLSFGILLGMMLVPNGKQLGKFFGDRYPPAFADQTPGNDTAGSAENTPQPPTEYSHSWGVFFTVLGTVLLDFDADACQSPSRAYLLDIVLPEDQAKGLSTFSLMAGLGGFMGYAMGGYNWDQTWIGVMLGGHMKTVFSLITIIFIGCVSYTVTSFSEIPLLRLQGTNEFYMTNKNETGTGDDTHINYGSTSSTSKGIEEQVTSFTADVNTNDLNPTDANGSTELKVDAEKGNALPLETTQVKFLYLILNQRLA
ncbi:hypothetical protein GE061_002162 [Apolygus lucorum]|uniref:Proton-associated sugar transporter A n=1 Tax=Apolygus lucorum TaxID=248454 RepID=A0A8S9X4D0_APOLU|nr:hypothetical protein GE061_002162 [Apolygus lucorum]